jgi:hypothetical protein
LMIASCGLSWEGIVSAALLAQGPHMREWLSR